MSHELDILLYVSGGGSSGEIVTQGISSETTLKALSNAYAHEYVQKSLPCLPWLKCRNLEGVSGEHQKMRAAGQGIQALEKYHKRHPLHKTCRRVRSNKT
jgi:hypothetical protein